MEVLFMANLSGFTSYTETDTGITVVTDMIVGGHDKQVSVTIDSEDNQVEFSNQARDAVEDLINDVFYNSHTIIDILRHYPDTYDEVQSYFFNVALDIFLKGNDNESNSEMLKRIYLLTNNLAKYLWFNGKPDEVVSTIENDDVNRYIRKIYMESELHIDSKGILYDKALSKYLDIHVYYLSESLMTDLMNTFVENGLIEDYSIFSGFTKVHSTIGTFIFANRYVDDCCENFMKLQTVFYNYTNYNINQTEVEVVMKLLYKNS